MLGLNWYDVISKKRISDKKKNIFSIRDYSKEIWGGWGGETFHSKQLHVEWMY